MLRDIIKSTQTQLTKRIESSRSVQSIIDRADVNYFKEPLFCPYQLLWLYDKSPVAVIEKSRQIGFTYVFAFRAVYKAARNIRDFIYTSYNKESAKEFIKECSRWAKVFNIVFQVYQSECISNSELHIFEIKFLNLRSIYAVSGDAVNLRGKPGADILIDEVAYKDQPIEEILAAGMATLIHGGSIRIGSTHAGSDSDFNCLCLKVKANEIPYSHHRTTFREAISQGLYRRICVKEKKQWTPELEREWVDMIYAFYGIRSIEELDVIPSDFAGEGEIFDKFQRHLIPEMFTRPWQFKFFRYHDLAASDDKNETAFYSASIKCAYDTETQIITVIEYEAERLAPLEGDNRIIDLAIRDTNDTATIIELEPGSSGIKYFEIMKERLVSKGLFNTHSYSPKLQKLLRAIPAGNAVAKGEIKILDSPAVTPIETILRKFSAKRKPLITDIADCLSGIYDFIINQYNW